MSCVQFQGSQLEILDDYFSNNTGSVGGALYISGYLLQVNIKNTIFVGNFADVGGAIGIAQDINRLTCIITNCHFNKNIATG